MDVHNAFLHGDLEEEVHMRLLPGFEAHRTHQVCRLKKSLYGLRQAPRCWFAKLTATLSKYGCAQSKYDHSLFIYTKGTIHLNVLVYVDDLVVSGNDSIAIQSFKDYLSKCFHMKDLGRLKYFLGIEVSRNATGICLSQRKYTLDIISDASLLGAKPIGTPIEQNHNLALADGVDMMDPAKY